MFSINPISEMKEAEAMKSMLTIMAIEGIPQELRDKMQEWEVYACEDVLRNSFAAGKFDD